MIHTPHALPVGIEIPVEIDPAIKTRLAVGLGVIGAVLWADDDVGLVTTGEFLEQFRDVGDVRIQALQALRSRRLSHHEGEKIILASREDFLGISRLLKTQDVMVITAHFPEGIGRRLGAARQVRCVDTDGACDTLRSQHRRMPDDDAAPVMPDEDSGLVPQRIQQTGQVGHQHIHRVGRLVGRTIRTAKSTQIRHDHPISGIRENLDLVFPGIGEFRPPMRQQKRRPIFRASQVDRQLYTIGLDAGRRGKMAHVASCSGSRRCRRNWL